MKILLSDKNNEGQELILEGVSIQTGVIKIGNKSIPETEPRIQVTFKKPFSSGMKPIQVDLDELVRAAQALKPEASETLML